MRKSKDAIINYNQHNPSNIIVIFIMANKEKRTEIKSLIFGNRKKYKLKRQKKWNSSNQRFIHQYKHFKCHKKK